MAKKQKSGLYRSKIKIGVDEHGKDIYKYISGKTKKELEANRQKAIAYYIDGTGLVDDVLFGPYAIKWYRSSKEPYIKPSTRSSYRTVLNNYVLPAFGDRKLRAILTSDLQQFFADLKSHSPTYRVIAKTIYNGIFLTACADRILDRNPMALVKIKSTVAKKKPASPDTGKHRVLTLEERRRITDLCANSRDALYIALLYYLGLRQGEAAGLRWGDIDWKEGMVHVQCAIDKHAANAPSTPKTDASNRMIPLPQPLAALLSGLRGLPDLYILHNKDGSPLSANQRNSLWKNLVNDFCGIPDITAHALRHNYITMCWEAGIDVYATARFVGHANVATTLRIYTHLSAERAEENAKAVQELFERTNNKVAQKLHNELA